MRTLRFALACLVTICVAVVLVLTLEPSNDPDDPPKPRPRRGVERVGQVPGSNLEGIAGAPLVMQAVAERHAAIEAERIAALEAATVPPVEVEEALPGVRASAPPSTGGQSVDWDAVAVCETGGDWSMSGSIYSGGLGFANGSWSAYGGTGNAGSATREEQIAVAERIRADNGGGLRGAWGCWESGGLGR